VGGGGPLGGGGGGKSLSCRVSGQVIEEAFETSGNIRPTKRRPIPEHWQIQGQR